MSTPDLPGHLLRSVLLSMEASGHDTPALIRRLRPNVLSAARVRHSWDELILLLETFFAQHGVDATQGVMQHLASRHSSVRQAAELLGSPRLTYLVLLEALQARPSVVSLQWRSATPGLQIRLELLKGLRPSLVFFQCCAWFLASVPRVRGGPDARIHGARISERELDCIVFPPPESELTLAHSDSNVRALARELFRLNDGPSQAARSMPSVQGLQSRFELTRAEARVVRRLAEGRSIKRIAEEFHVSLETARTHAKRAMQKTDTHRQAELVSLVLNGER